VSPKPEQIEEWCDSEVTRHFLKILKSMLDRVYGQRSEVFFPGEPNKTQESKASLLGMEATLDDLIQAIDEKDLSQLEEEEKVDEQVRHTPIRRPSSH
jgi:hypothetical protein